MFENLQLSKSNSLHDNAYSRATESISKQLGPKKLKKVKIIKTKKSDVSDSSTKAESTQESQDTQDSSKKSKKPKFVIKNKKKKSNKSAVNVSEKIKSHRLKIKKVVTMVTQKISSGQTSGLKQKINLIVNAFDKPPQNNDPEILAALQRLKEMQEEL